MLLLTNDTSHYTIAMTEQVIGVVGLGYVGLPLAYTFAKKGYDVIGYEINPQRIAELRDDHDSTNELTDEQLKEVSINYDTDPSVLKAADIVIMALPTPIDDNNKPDITILKKASETVGSNLKKGAIVVYESTVYPGTTEEICGPILEEFSGMRCGTDFTLGYSPERINPGDKTHTVDKIIKIVAGQDEETTDVLCDVYGSIITAGIHRAPNIQVAEMAKAIENAQRDLNIAFINEISMMCNKIGIRTKDVLEAAGTKWNFLQFQPGLVGGHCIGVDPYYLVEKAMQLGMDTHVITAGRSVNDGMAEFVADHIASSLANVSSPRVLVLGLTFKENVPDTRNSKSGHVIRLLKEKGCEVEVHDVQLTEAGITNLGFTPGHLTDDTYDAVVMLVPHREYLESPSALVGAVKEGGLFYDLKSCVDANIATHANRKYASL